MLHAFLALMLSTVLALPAQQLSSSQNLVSDQQALQVATQSLSAMKYVAASSIRAVGTIHSPDQDDGTFELIATGPRTFRTTTVRGGSTYVYLMNDGIGSATFAGKTRYIGGADVLGVRCPFLPFYSFIGELNRPDVVLQPVTQGSLAGKASYILSTVATDNSNPSFAIQNVSELELDANSFLPLKFRSQLVHKENIEIVSHLEYSFADYRLEGSLLVPHQITLTVDGALSYVVTLNAFEFGVPASLTVTMQ